MTFVFKKRLVMTLKGKNVKKNKLRDNRREVLQNFGSREQKVWQGDIDIVTILLHVVSVQLANI